MVHSFSRSVSQLVASQLVKLLSLSVGLSVGWPIDQSVSQLVCRWVSESDSQSVTESFKRSFARSDSMVFRICRWSRHAESTFFHRKHFIISGRCTAGNDTTMRTVSSGILLRCISSRGMNAWIIFQAFVEDVNNNTQ